MTPVPEPRASKVLALAGVGGDSHSIGLLVLRRFLVRAGFRVHYLATQNSLDEICAAGLGTDAVLLSNMDGHARYYLRDLRQYQEMFGVADRCWYLGGHPSVATDEDSLRQLLSLGFRRVFPGYVEPGAVIAMLDADLGVADIGGGVGGGTVLVPVRAAPSRIDTPGDSLDERDEVLSQWHTGADASRLESNAHALSRCAALSTAHRQADAQRRTLIQPRTGVARVDEQIALFDQLRGAGADVLSFQIDSLTRNNAHDQVELLLKEGGAAEDEFIGLNGYPAVNHGVDALRRITAGFKDVPLQVRHSTRDPRLLAEISFAGGVSAFEGGAITYNLPYYRDYDPWQSVRTWRYVDALAGLYHHRFGIVIDREFFGVLTASLVPPCLAVVADVLEALLAAQGGVKSVSLGYAEQGYRPQDVAAIRALREVCERYLARYSFDDVSVHTVFHQYMGAFPRDAEKSRALLRGSAVTARLSGATRLMLKTYVEAVRIPSGEDNASSLRLVRGYLDAETDHDCDWSAVADEQDLIVREAGAILDTVLDAAGGDPGAAVVTAIERGLLDIPFSPSLWNAGVALSVRDRRGAVRFADPGRIPLPDGVRERHRRLVAERLSIERKGVEEVVEHDVLRIARGHFDDWPLGPSHVMAGA